MNFQQGVKQHLDALTQWYQRPGRAPLKRQIADGLSAALTGLAVQEVLHLGAGGFETALAGSAQERATFFTDMASEHLLGREDNYLPLKPDTQECVVLLHALDVAANPHAVLRELNRISARDGYVVVVGFNRFSPWGAYRAATSVFRRRGGFRMPWNLNFYSPGRVKDWLELLNFHTRTVKTYGYGPVVHDSALLLKATSVLDTSVHWGLPRLGNVYMLVAQKRTVPLTPIRLKWKLRSGLFKPGGVASPGSSGI